MVERISESPKVCERVDDAGLGHFSDYYYMSMGSKSSFNEVQSVVKSHMGMHKSVNEVFVNLEIAIIRIGDPTARDPSLLSFP